MDSTEEKNKQNSHRHEKPQIQSIQHHIKIHYDQMKTTVKIHVEIGFALYSPYDSGPRWNWSINLHFTVLSEDQILKQSI